MLPPTGTTTIATPPRAAARVALVLGGGAARGLAHIGVLQVLEEEGIALAGIAGASMGAIVGGVYAAGGGVRGSGRQLARMLAIAPRSPFPNGGAVRGMRTWVDTASYLRHDLFGLGLHDGAALEAAIEAWVGPRKIEELGLPFVAVATDVCTGERVELDRGPLAAAVHASAAMPGVFQPVELGGRLLVDGGVIENVPIATAARLPGGVVLAVSVHPPLDPRPPRTGLGLLARAEAIRATAIEERALAGADVALHVPLPASVGLFDFDRASEIIAMGNAAMRARLPALRRALERAEREAGPPRRTARAT